MKNHLLWAFLQLACLATRSQELQLKFSHLGTEEGLSQSNVTSILQDSRGFMWFGTRDGLNRYDGYEFTVFKNNPEDPRSLANNFITCIREDHNGDLWIATWGGGVDRYDRLRNRFVHYLTNSFTRFINALLPDDSGNIWIGTNGAGADVLNPVTGSIVHYQDAHGSKGVSGNDVKTILEDHRHRIWLGTANGGLDVFDPATGSFRAYTHAGNDSRSLSADAIQNLYEDRQHRLWIATQGGGLDLFDSATNGFRHFLHDANNPASISGNVLMSLAEDEAGNLWVGTDNGGLDILQAATGRFHTYKKDEIDINSLNNNSIHSLFRDSQGNMWVGTYSGGVDLCSKAGMLFRQYVHTSVQGSLTDNNVLCIREDHAKELWIGTDGGGLDRFNRQTGVFTHYRHDPDNSHTICGNYVLTVCEDDRQHLWVGTWGDGLTLLDGDHKVIRHFRNDPADPRSLSVNNVYSIARDKDNTIWVATYGGGLNRYERPSNSFTHYRHAPADPTSLSSDLIHSLLVDSKGNLWIGTFDGGVDKLDKKRGNFTHFTHSASPHSLSDNSINYLYEDRQGNIWICTSVGLDMLDPATQQITSYDMKDGLPSNVIYGIQEDNNRHYWISTNNGLSMYEPFKRRFHNFSVADGLQSNEFKAHSCTAASDGQLYFGGVNGFNEFYPDSIHILPFRPHLVLTRFQIFNKDVPIADSADPVSPLKKDITDEHELTLSYRSSVITFEFASLNYSAKAKRSYAYMLAGFDEKWNSIGAKRTATYTNIDPGSYIFRVRALTDDGKWLPAEASIRLIITPPFWQTWWFRLLAVAIIAGSGIAFHRIRMGIIEAQKKKLEQEVAALLDKAVAQGKYEIASDVLHDIGNAMVGIEGYLTRIRRLLEQDSPENLQKLADYIETNRPALEASIGEAKTGALVTMLGSMAEVRRNNREEMNRSVSEQLAIIGQIQGILDIQRQYINGAESQERKPVNLKKLVDDSMAMLAGTAERHGIIVSMNVSANLPTIKGDRTRLMQVILNLLKNSIESASLLEHDCRKKISIKTTMMDGLPVLQIYDNGRGYSADIGGRLFDRGFTTKPSSAGLGLYNCRVIMESHGGSVELCSEGIKKGALATVRFRV